jgi:SAM-dependent methyltransferase
VTVGGYEEWRALDAAGDPQAMLAFLDVFSAIPDVATAKARSLDLLDVGPGSRVLDVGCGTGTDALTLAARLQPGGEVLGVDSSAGAIEIARERAAARSGVVFAKADATALPFADATFDAARADRVIQHVAEPELAASELARVTRAGGMVVVTEATFRPETKGDGTSTGMARDLVPFIPYLLNRAGIADVEVESADIATVAGPEMAPVLGIEPGRVTIHILHFAGRRTP